MKLSTRQDIAAPVDQVFQALTDFDSFERAAMRRGIEVARTDTLGAHGAGMGWISKVPYRGKPRELTAEIGTYERPEQVAVNWAIMGLDGALDVQLVALSPRHSRIVVGLDMRPKTLTARLFLQSLRLAKSSLHRKFSHSVLRFAKDLEGRLGVNPNGF
ncbi:SRPBCC family protein [Actibacterium sp.]|uniref:SRPBCC family protein n=1 Tax=Actibacterium sp. TaxID=1872125 RepID=UPI003565524A